MGCGCTRVRHGGGGPRPGGAGYADARAACVRGGPPDGERGTVAGYAPGVRSGPVPAAFRAPGEATNDEEDLL